MTLTSPHLDPAESVASWHTQPSRETTGEGMLTALVAGIEKSCLLISCGPRTMTLGGTSLPQ